MQEKSSLGLVLERVNDPPRIFGEITLPGDSDAILEFLKAMAHFRYICYLLSVLEVVSEESLGRP